MGTLDFSSNYDRLRDEFRAAERAATPKKKKKTQKDYLHDTDQRYTIIITKAQMKAIKQLKKTQQVKIRDFMHDAIAHELQRYEQG